MFVTPAPIGLLIILSEFDKAGIFAMVFFYPHTIRLIFVCIPLVIVIVCSVVVGACVPLIRGLQRDGRYCQRGNQGSA